MTDEELIARLQELDPVLEVEFDTQLDVERNPYGATKAIEKALYLLRDQADRIEALVKELSVSNEIGRAFEEDAGQQRARAERLEAALRVARVHVANNAEGWSVSRGAARNDLTIVDAALPAVTPAPDARLRASVAQLDAMTPEVRTLEKEVLRLKAKLWAIGHAAGIETKEDLMQAALAALRAGGDA